MNRFDSVIVTFRSHNFILQIRFVSINWFEWDNLDLLLKNCYPRLYSDGILVSRFINTFRNCSLMTCYSEVIGQVPPIWQSFLPCRIGALIKSLQRAKTWSWEDQTGPQRAALAESNFLPAMWAKIWHRSHRERRARIRGPDTRDTVKCFLRVHKTHVDCAEGLKLKNKYV